MMLYRLSQVPAVVHDGINSLLLVVAFCLSCAYPMTNDVTFAVVAVALVIMTWVYCKLDDAAKHQYAVT